MATTRKNRKTTRRIPRIQRSPRASRKKLSLHFGEAELRTLAFICTLALAALAIYLQIYHPVVWTFLGMAIGRAGLRGI